MPSDSTKAARKQYEQNFAKELAALNTAQRQAVETIEGPVLVIAGPGTGKTHILSARIGNILQKTDTQPHNILCLTYTDAGAHAMRQRLLFFIGPEAHRIHIYTFHSFCNRVIQDNLGIFGMREMEAIAPLEQIELIREIINNLASEHPLKPLKGGHYRYEGHLRDLFNRMKTEGWTIDWMNQQIDAYLTSLTTHPDFIYRRNFQGAQKGDPNPTKIRRATKRMERLRAATALFEDYEQAMQKRGRYDFADMILWVTQAFDEHKDLLRNYQEQYLYILVDEFQDTNGTQNRILHQLINYWKNPNIFVVGDDDQSIFEFQGARVKNMADFHERYKDHIQLILLTENYRSSQHILDTAKVLIDHNELRLVKKLRDYQLDKNLTATHPEFGQLPSFPHIVEYHNVLHEDGDIVRQIERLQRQGVG